MKNGSMQKEVWLRKETGELNVVQFILTFIFLYQICNDEIVSYYS